MARGLSRVFARGVGGGAGGVTRMVIGVFAAVSMQSPITTARADDLGAAPVSLDTRLAPAVLITGIPGLTSEAPTLRERTAQANVPGLSIAVVTDGEIAWAEGFGFADDAGQAVVTERTLFQAASISKPVAAAGAMRLVEMGEMELDGDIEEHLVSWRIPASSADVSWDRTASPVTLRQLLGHNAGMTVRGFPGYGSFDEVPSAIGVLDGLGNTAPVVVEAVQGSRRQYSGGGYTVAQVAMVDASAEHDDFPSLMSALVFEPLGMVHSTFEQPLPEELCGRAASGHTSDGTRLEGGWVVHPEMAAAGLWTTPSDLALFFASLQRGMAGVDGPVLSAGSVGEMLRFEGDVRYGLGLNIGTERIGHGGGNRGFRCVATFFNEGGDGVVIMSNWDNGWALNSDVLRTIFTNLDWPGLRAVEKTVVELSERELGLCAGAYEIPGYGTFVVEVDEQRIGLNVTLPDGQRFRILPESPTEFFDLEDGVPIVFHITGNEPATGASWSEATASRK